MLEKGRQIMKDAVARKNLADLQQKYFLLEEKLSALEHKIDNQTHLENKSYWDYGCGNKYLYRYPLRIVINLLLPYLGLELETQTKEEKIVLKKKEDNNG